MAALTRYRISVDAFERMGATGIIPEDARVELINGEIVEMSPVYSPHASCVDRVTAFFFHAAGKRAQIRVQSPITVGRFSQPQPDVTLLCPRDDFYAAAHPTVADVLLVIEVSDSSLESDRSVKVPLYLAEGIREVWIVNLGQQQLEVHRGSAVPAILLRGETVAPAAFPELTVRVEDLLG